MQLMYINIATPIAKCIYVMLKGALDTMYFICLDITCFNTLN